MQDEDRKAVIVGAGIGGLAAGIALAKSGWTVEILERAATLTEVGAGLQISPNGMKVLDRLGVLPALEPYLFFPEALSLVIGAKERQIFRLPLKHVAVERWGERYANVHRADLQSVLRSEFEALPNSVLRLGVEATGYVRERDGAAVYLDRSERVWGNLVIGADGIRSEIREAMVGSDRARFTGNVAWRLTVPLEALSSPPPPEARVWAGAGKHAVTTRIRSGELVNFVGIVEQDDWKEEGWTIPGLKDDLRRDFGTWNKTLSEIIDAASETYRWALFDRPPMSSWSDGPVALLGDAAHPMLPSMAQGAVQALEDAVVLAAALSGRKNVSSGLKRYFAIRKPRTAQIQRRSAANLKMFHRAGLRSWPLTFGPIWFGAKLSPGLVHSGQDWVYSYDASAEADKLASSGNTSSAGSSSTV